MIDESRIGECDACHARFKVPASFRADRARCRECGGVVILERTQPVPRPPLEKSRKPKSMHRSPSEERALDGRPEASSPAVDKREPQRAADHVSSHGTALAPTGAPRPVAAKPSGDNPALEKERAAASKDEKKPGGVLGSIVAAAKAAMWRKKRGGSKS